MSAVTLSQHLMTSKIIWEPKGVYVKTVGIPTFEETYKLVESLFLNPKFETKHYQIYDLSEITRIEQSEDSIRFLSAISRAKDTSIRVKKRRIAFVMQDIPPNRKRFELYRDTLKSTKSETQAFEDVESARAWTMTLPY